MALPAQTHTWSTRRNIPLLDVSTLSQATKSLMLAFVRSLLDIEATGTLGGTRHANSVWTVVKSCNSSAIATGTNNWLALTDLVWNTPGSAHSWIILQNTTLGYQLLIDLNYAAGTNLRISACKIAAAYTGGTTTTGPTSTAEFTMGVVAGGTSAVGGAVISVSGGTIYAHFTTNQEGQWFLQSSKVTWLYSFNTFIAMLKTGGADASDTYNVFFLETSSDSVRGAPNYVTLSNSPRITGRTGDNVAVMNAGGIRAQYLGGTDPFGAAYPDTYKGYPCWKPDIYTTQSPPTPSSGYRGNFVDLWAISIDVGRVGQVYPSVAGAIYVVAGNFLVPFIGGAPAF